MRKVAWGLLMVLAMTACSNTESGTEPAPTNSDSADGAADGASLGSCVEQYSPETLGKREYALDGIVKNIAAVEVPGQPDGETLIDYVVTLQVNSWFKGGSEPEIALKSSVPLAPAVSSAGGNSIKVGERLLTSGDGGFMWSCGFTIVHSASAEAEWKAALQ